MPSRAECIAVIRSTVSALVEFGPLRSFGVRPLAHLLAVKTVLASLVPGFFCAFAKSSRTVPSFCLCLAWPSAGIFKHKVGTLFDFHLWPLAAKL